MAGKIEIHWGGCCELLPSSLQLRENHHASEPELKAAHRLPTGVQTHFKAKGFSVLPILITEKGHFFLSLGVHPSRKHTRGPQTPLSTPVTDGNVTGMEPKDRAWSAHPTLQPRGPQQNPGWVRPGGQVTQRRVAESPSAPTSPPPGAGLLGGKGREPDPGRSRSGTGIGSQVSWRPWVPLEGLSGGAQQQGEAAWPLTQTCKQPREKSG